MKCPFCNSLQDKVVDSRENEDGLSIRRRRECLQCKKRYTTYEEIEKIPIMVIKKDGRREKFSREKILKGLLHSCEKRPISMEQLEGIAGRVEAKLQSSLEKEIPSKRIGELVIKELHKVDKVAYVRFASVYREFKDVDDFSKEVKELK
ncbi:transcriptional regulator NrdR [Candidatus Desantisbacteria bacterium CG_4_10_14_0_8_um_filter_48_22]|uniref:Transcriptional repressor NrdR n=1 Tax=Candidatus Desantisbacteria bacterium CG_4_10_14_0_8_um_filter_48_22 TaxID=1974543 RepID=A0A2M7SET3_9BACT|nr:MAG: transcriptional regulator NrdR [Candidatus Desantisbacteria bacterium CG1_02_49_89]PIV55327.1 MAG: transcriptional regulator NrdR [Candidatus Desantisbacteria bacterium CG02_land_8_20_14_3_00_49_13]PIZ18026.1 MAG: transcriptional regulator NrdR [Candidatus Desantisbacteria bacterium CG_4_10_14_0_8_um_filter_48_22]PJB27452.1 MAG: transcriptional regulator NrdR [Candidatus Desantisbacteria bacterium CG_4_9_14_3_um_filter_50_7]